MSDYAYANLVAPENTGIGLAEYALVAPISDIATISVPTAPFTNPGDSVTVTTAHTFKTGKKFAKFLLSPEKQSLDGKSVGDKGSQISAFEYKLFVPGLYAVALEAFAAIRNTPLIVLVPDANCEEGVYYQLGCDCSYAYAAGEITTGTTASGAKGHMLSITWNAPKLFIYDVDGGPLVYT